METSRLLQRIKTAVRSVEPSAEIILFGSRAREDARPDSDWDLLIVLEGALSRERERAIQEALYDLELECGEALVSVIKSEADWNAPRYRVSPFFQNVQREGRTL